jgi:phage tail-like protein
VLDGAVVGSFTEVTGLEVEIAAEEAVCPKGGGDCDDTDTLAWESSLLQSLWQLTAAADEAEQAAWLSSRAKHDVAMNAIRNIRARVHELEQTLADSSVSLKTKHDTVKNAIGNIRACVRVLTEVTAGESGVPKAALAAMGQAADTTQDLVASREVRKRPGRPTYGNITLKGAAMGTAPGLLDWVTSTANGKTERKSGSIIYLDRDGREVMRYNFFEAWPVRYSAPGMTEQIEIAVEKVERAR